MGQVIATDFMERRVATDAVDNGDKASLVTRGEGTAVVTMGNLLLSWYRSAREPLASAGGGVRRVLAISFQR
jgi:hypothetical protein